jgi:hypothetical protein
MAKPIIGRLYCPKDNSFIKRLDNGTEGMLYDVWCRIISEPYVATSYVSPIDGEKRQDMFVNVASVETDIEYRVLFNESWILNRWSPFEEEEKTKEVKEIPNKMLN